MSVKIYNKIFKVGVGFIFCLLFLIPHITQAQTVTAEEIFQLVNNERMKNNLAPLTINATLQQIAIERADDMIENNYFAHQSPTGSMPWDLALEKNYEYQFIGENLATDWLSANEAIQAWMTSSAHQDNILNPEFQDTGIAVANKENHYLIVQIFGKELTSNNQIISNTQTDTNRQIINIDAKNKINSVSTIIPNSEGKENQNVLGTIYTNEPRITKKSAYFNFNYGLLMLTISYFPLVIYLHLRINATKYPF